MSKFLEHSEGKAKMTVTIFGISLLVFLTSWMIIFGIGGAIGVAVGVSIAVVSLILSIASGGMSVFIYLDWLDNG